jgi:hypothetical protein
MPMDGTPSGTVTSMTLTQGTGHVDFYDLSLDGYQAAALANYGDYFNLFRAGFGARNTVSAIGTLGDYASPNTVVAASGTNLVQGWLGPDRMIGGSGNGYFHMLGGDTIVGGGGTNTVDMSITSPLAVMHTSAYSFIVNNWDNTISTFSNIQSL